MRVRRERAKSMAPEERRQAIIEATLPLLEEHGHAVTTRQIAEAAGIAEGTIFRVFPDKRALLLATAEETMNPASARGEMEQSLALIPELRDKIAATVDQLDRRLEKVMTVMMALRGLIMNEGPTHADKKQPPGPPLFVTESNRKLLEGLTTFLFEPHREELRVAPDRAALLLRSLVFGSRHPGMEEEAKLTNDEIVDLVLHGVGLDGER